MGGVKAPPYFLEYTMDIKLEIDTFLAQALDGDTAIDESIVNKFGERCKDALRKQFNADKHEFSVRMSSIGKPLCQQQLDQQGAEAEIPSPSLKMKLAYGDIVEALVMAVMEAAEIEIDSFQEPVEYQLGKTKIKGTLDVVIDNKVYDIKSASKYAFDMKFSRPDGFDKINKDDPFGYVSQGYLYAAAKDLPFGGWIAFNKETGAIAVTEAPPENEYTSVPYKERAIAVARKNAEALRTDAPFERCFRPVDEFVRKKPTGNKTLHVNCRYCKFKQTCWGDELVFRKNPRGSTFRWYFGEPK
tara:strand:- start:51 stop:953 length:903 start_codon:yes stop_codon:yes gene_type:complete